jgi:hypothetical protein
MEVDGLEPLQETPCLSNIDDSAARNPARFEEALITSVSKLSPKQQMILLAIIEQMAAEPAEKPAEVTK